MHIKKSINKVNHWLHDISNELRLDEDGITGIARDDATVAMIEVNDADNVCRLYAIACPLPEADTEAGLYAALELNRLGLPLGGCWLAWDSDINMLCLCNNLYIPAFDTITFHNALQNFFNAIDIARSELTNYVREEEADFSALERI